MIRESFALVMHNLFHIIMPDTLCLIVSWYSLTYLVVPQAYLTLFSFVFACIITLYDLCFAACCDTSIPSSLELLYQCLYMFPFASCLFTQIIGCGVQPLLCSASLFIAMLYTIRWRSYRIVQFQLCKVNHRHHLTYHLISYVLFLYCTGITICDTRFHMHTLYHFHFNSLPTTYYILDHIFL